MRSLAVQGMQREDGCMPDLSRRSEGNAQGVPLVAGRDKFGGWWNSDTCEFQESGSKCVRPCNSLH